MSWMGIGIITIAGTQTKKNIPPVTEIGDGTKSRCIVSILHLGYSFWEFLDQRDGGHGIQGITLCGAFL